MTEQPALAPTPTWTGTKEQQRLAKQVFEAMVLQGSFFPQNVPIRQSLDNLAAFLAQEQGVTPDSLKPALEKALAANDQVFQRSSLEDGTIIFSTTRLGYYTEPLIDTRHSFATRLYEPENPLPLDDLDAVITRTRPALTTIEPVYISDYWQQRAPVNPDADVDTVDLEPVAVPTPVKAEPVVEPVAVEPPPVEQPKPQPKVEHTAPIITISTSQPTEAAPVVSNATSVALADGTLIDLALPAQQILAEYGPLLSDAIRQSISDDPLRRIVSFGDEYYPEDAVVSLSKGDLRRIREYILEQNEPMPDTAILNDVYYKTAREHDYATFRFALNYRLNREKDFEFVGVPGARLWSAKGLPTIGTKRLKTSELGQFYSFLEENPEFDDSLSELSADQIREARQLNRFLTFFEWEYGVLPYDAAMKALLPPPLLPEQRTAILRIEVPQHYSVYLAELRYPTNNRGGWLHGLEEFFKEHLVPGALITLAATDDPSIWTIQYAETNGTEVRLLQQDDKKNRFAFANHTYYADADSDLVTSQERLPRLKNMKVLPSGERRRITSTAGYVLEQVGQSRPGTNNGFELSMADLMLSMNVQRPATQAYLRSALSEDENFLVEDDNVLYFPPPEDMPTVEAEDDDEE